ncbi:hypothetical protein NEOLEDRAFT_1075887 [Neolentinus lepideus HHB14362 ss-1]|uniref:Uncharacterized protein n=1 Tax=Neolentinus lepideus HHB14362 ss-1 TaxID=1314782 RepID=A0A165NZ90_9AGAM|nr:hypothetical protein NEOLEDRAFT_1075887 [Neolentinus lepideus HHB14362 ss-1]
MANIQQSKQSHPPRPPVTLPMLTAIKNTLHQDDPFDACIWAICACCTCAFWGMMQFGEVTVPSQNAFHGSHHLKCSDSVFALDLDGHLYA